MLRGLIFFAAALAVSAGLIVYDFWWLPRHGAQISAGEQVAPVDIGGPFTLVDQTGATRHPEDFTGKLMLVYFGYSYCPDACPTALQDMSRAIDLLNARGDQVQPIFITIDPARDTVQQLKVYAENFHPRLVALTGTPEQIAAAARAYRVYYAKSGAASGNDYLMDHSSFIYLMGRDGRYISHFPPGVSADQLAAAIAARLRAPGLGDGVVH